MQFWVSEILTCHITRDERMKTKRRKSDDEELKKEKQKRKKKPMRIVCERFNMLLLTGSRRGNAFMLSTTFPVAFALFLPHLFRSIQIRDFRSLRLLSCVLCIRMPLSVLMCQPKPSRHMEWSKCETNAIGNQVTFFFFENVVI